MERLPIAGRFVRAEIVDNLFELIESDDQFRLRAIQRIRQRPADHADEQFDRVDQSRLLFDLDMSFVMEVAGRKLGGSLSYHFDGKRK